MDIKNLMMGMLIGCLIVMVSAGVLLDSALKYHVNSAEMNLTLIPINDTFGSNQKALDDLANAMQNQFTNHSRGVLGELDDLYRSAGGVARLTIGSVGMMISIITIIGAQFPILMWLMAFAITGFIIALIISIAYLVFFRIPR